MELWGLGRDWGPVVFPDGFGLVSPALNDKTTFKTAEIKHHKLVLMGQRLSEIILVPLAPGQPQHPNEKRSHSLSSSRWLFLRFLIDVSHRNAYILWSVLFMKWSVGKHNMNWLHYSMSLWWVWGNGMSRKSRGKRKKTMGERERSLALT